MSGFPAKFEKSSRAELTPTSLRDCLTRAYSGLLSLASILSTSILT